jgi:hypothetical protein
MMTWHILFNYTPAYLSERRYVVSNSFFAIIIGCCITQQLSSFVTVCQEFIYSSSNCFIQRFDLKRGVLEELCEKVFSKETYNVRTFLVIFEIILHNVISALLTDVSFDL